MAENVTSIKDPTVSFEATEKLRLFVKENKSEVCSFTEPVPKNILDLNSEKDVCLKLDDLKWFESFLKHKRDQECCDFEPLIGHSLDREIYKFLISNKKELAQFIKYDTGIKKKSSNLYLHELLEGSKFSLPKNEVIQRNPILAARIEKLKKDQAERDYKAMTRNIDTSKKFIVEDTLSYQMNMMNRHLIAVGQFIVSVGAGFAFGFLGIELLIGDLEFGFRLLLGIASALVIALAEFYFLAKHLNEEEVEQRQTNHSKTFNFNRSRSSKTHQD